MRKPYNDFEDDETCLAPCKDRVWLLMGNRRMTTDIKNREYRRRHYWKHRDYYRQYYQDRKNKIKGL